MSLPNSNFYLMPQFKTNGKGFNRAIGLQAWQWQWCTLTVVNFSTKYKVINKEKEAKRKLLQ